jgi:hypothetical protein
MAADKEQWAETAQGGGYSKPPERRNLTTARLGGHIKPPMAAEIYSNFGPPKTESFKSTASLLRQSVSTAHSCQPRQWL